MTQREKLIEILSRYFQIGDSYAYNLTRDKEAFAVGTMSLEDFEEFDDFTVADIVDNLLENGVIVPPCKVGQTVYSCLGYAYKVKKIVIESNSKHITFVLESGLNGQLIFDETCFGKTVFLSHEDAGKALAERSKE